MCASQQFPRRIDLRRYRHLSLALEPLESRQLLAANPIVTSTDGAITIGADFTSPEVHSLGWDEPLSDISIETELPLVNGYERTASAEISLTGTANQSKTASIQVGGRAAHWSAADGMWSLNSIALNPGISRVVVQAFDAANNEIDRQYTDIWYDTSGTTVLPVSVPFGSTWQYLDDGSDQGTAWRTAAPDPAWPTGTAQLGYGDGDETTVVGSGPAGSRFATTYFRHTFEIPAEVAALLTHISIDLLRDDGAAVYINGVEVVRTDNLPGDLGDDAVRFDTFADEGGTEENLRSTFVVPDELVPGLLRDGENTIAVEVHQHDADSSDMSFDLGLVVAQPPAVGFHDVSGILPSTTTTWTAAAGPYYIASDVTVPADGTLIIEPGTTVYFANEQSLIVEGRLVADGTPAEIIRFSRVPGSGTISDGIQFAGTMQDNRISYAVVEWGGTRTNNGLIGLDESKLTLDHVTLDHAERRRIRSIDSALTVRNSVFTDIFGPDAVPSTDNLSEHIWGRNVPEGEEFVVQNNIFGTTKGHNDSIDFDAGVRPEPIPQILNNTFLGGGDDAMDFEGDVHIEGNLIMNFIKDEWNTGSGNSNGISAGVGRHYFMSRNIFYNVEQVAQVKQDSFLTFVNNTVVGAHVSATYYQRPTGGEFGRGAYLDGNIFLDTPLVFDEYLDTTDLTLNRSAIETDEGTFGVGNITADVMLSDPDNFDFNLMPGSPAIGAGPNGINMGAFVPAGASIAGEPPVFTQNTDATLTVGGPDVFAYRYRLDDGPWSEIFTVDGAGTKEQIVPPISLAGLTPGIHSVEVLKRNSAGVWQSESEATQSVAWFVGGDGAEVIDALCAESQAEAPDARYDLNGDGEVNDSDQVFFVDQVLGTAMGDANLDGRVDAADLNQVGIHWRQSDPGLGWAQGNFNCDGRIDASDLNVLGIKWRFGEVMAAEAARAPRAPLAGGGAVLNAVVVDQAVAEKVAPIESVTADDVTSAQDIHGPRLRSVWRRDAQVTRRSSTGNPHLPVAEHMVDDVWKRFELL